MLFASCYQYCALHTGKNGLPMHYSSVSVFVLPPPHTVPFFSSNCLAIAILQPQPSQCPCSGLFNTGSWIQSWLPQQDSQTWKISSKILISLLLPACGWCQHWVHSTALYLAPSVIIVRTTVSMATAFCTLVWCVILHFHRLPPRLYLCSERLSVFNQCFFFLISGSFFLLLLF